MGKAERDKFPSRWKVEARRETAVLGAGFCDKNWSYFVIGVQEYLDPFGRREKLLLMTK